jgi:hypothetical protein
MRRRWLVPAIIALGIACSSGTHEPAPVTTNPVASERGSAAVVSASGSAAVAPPGPARVQLVMGPRLGDEYVTLIASTPDRAIVSGRHGERYALLEIDLHGDSTRVLYTTSRVIGDGACLPDLRRCVFREILKDTMDEATGAERSQLFEFDGKKATRLDLSMHTYSSLHVSPDGRYLVSSFHDHTAWDLPRRRKLSEIDGASAVVGWQGDGAVIEAAEATGRHYQLWHLESGKLEPIAVPLAGNAATSPDGKRRIEVRDDTWIVTRLPDGAPRTLAMPHDLDGSPDHCCTWLDAVHVVLPSLLGDQLGVLDTDTLTISRLGEVPADDPRTVHLVPGTARALVSSGAGTFLATVKP